MIHAHFSFTAAAGPDLEDGRIGFFQGPAERRWHKRPSALKYFDILPVFL